MQASIMEMEHALAVRVHPTGGYGDDYSWCCVIRPYGDLAVVELALISPTPDERRAAIAAIKARGFRRVQWERVVDGERRTTREFRI